MNDPRSATATITPPVAVRRLVVAYSGGRDSSALLAWLSTHAEPPVAALHVCHHLDPDAEAWVAHCRATCQALGVAFVRLDVTVDSTAGGLEAAARRARYDAIAAWLSPGDVLVSAHHADDQAETVLLQALRGTGMRGLAAMPTCAVLGAGHIWRPWLGVSREAIADYARTAGLSWVEDATNTDSVRGRGYLASHVWPAINARWPGASQHLARLATRAAEASEAIETLAALDHEAIVCDVPAAVSLDRLADLSQPRQREALRHWLRGQSVPTPDHRQLMAIMALATQREHNSPRVCWASHEVRRFNHRLFVMPSLDEAPDARLAWSAPVCLDLPGQAGRLRAAGGERPGAWPAGVTVVFRRGGERLIDSPGRYRRLKDWAREARLPPWVRERMPLVYHHDRLIAVADRWQHPKLAAMVGMSRLVLVWEHALVGDPRTSA